MDPRIYLVDGNRVGGRPAGGWAPWDLKAIKRDGFSILVSFECDRSRVSEDEVREAGLEHVKICVEDFTAPTIDQLREFNELCDRALAAGKKVLAHCWAGRGRTGTFLASRLVWTGMGAGDAIAEVRAKILKTQRSVAGAIEAGQEDILYEFERSLGRRVKRA